MTKKGVHHHVQSLKYCVVTFLACTAIYHQSVNFTHTNCETILMADNPRCTNLLFTTYVQMHGQTVDYM